MNMSQPFVVVFAGAPGSSKSIVAHYLSEQFGLPILSTDNIRYEVREDMMVANLNEARVLTEYEHRADDRRAQMLGSRRPFIFDCSVDRKWQTLKQELVDTGYNWFMIDMELSRDFFVQLFQATGRERAVDELDAYLGQHEAFMQAYSGDITIKITDKTFKYRTRIATEALRTFIGDKLPTVG